MSNSAVKDSKDSRFDIGLVLASFKKCEDDTSGRLTMDDYIAAYIELNK